MSRFQLTQKIDLSEISEGWNDAYVEISLPSYGEVQAVTQIDTSNEAAGAEAMMNFIKDHFVSGQLPENGKLVDLTSDDVKDLPLPVIGRITQKLLGEESLDPKS